MSLAHSEDKDYPHRRRLHRQRTQMVIEGAGFRYVAVNRFYVVYLNDCS